jgi:hypothetical protein
MINITENGISAREAQKELGVAVEVIAKFDGVKFNHKKGVVTGYITINEFRELASMVNED